MREPAIPEARTALLDVAALLLRGAVLACCLLGGAYAQEPEALGEDVTTRVDAADAAADYAEPAALIEHLHETLLSVMRNADEFGYSGRYAALEPVITTGFDTPLIVKVILSRHWSELNAQQQTDFVALFRRLSVATYASRFTGYDRESFVEVSREPLNRGRLLIKTELRHPERKPVRLDYLMHRAEDGKWRIISVIANGVNDLSLKRAEYAVVIKERGFDALVSDIGNKINDMERGKPGPGAL